MPPCSEAYHTHEAENAQIESKRRCTASYTPEDMLLMFEEACSALNLFHHERKTNVLPPRTRVALAVFSRDNFEYLQASIPTHESLCNYRQVLHEQSGMEGWSHSVDWKGVVEGNRVCWVHSGLEKSDG